MGTCWKTKEKVNIAIDAIIRNYFFDSMVSVVLPGPKDVTQSDFPANLETKSIEKGLDLKL